MSEEEQDLGPQQHAINTQSRDWCVYILATEDDRSTYVGATVDPARRLRQHNKEIKGGAKATSARVASGHKWRRLCRIVGFPDNHAALSFEWRLKSLARRSGMAALGPIERRLRCLTDLLAMDRPTTTAALYATYEGGRPRIEWDCAATEGRWLGQVCKE